MCKEFCGEPVEMKLDFERMLGYDLRSRHVFCNLRIERRCICAEAFASNMTSGWSRP
jgi:hypothetical protein